MSIKATSFASSKPLIIFLLYTVSFIALWQIFDLGCYVLQLQTTEFSLWFTAIFILVYIVRGFFYIPSLYFIVAASLIFPFPVSITCYLASVILSACLSYSIGRLIRDKNFFPRLRKFVEREDIKDRIEKQGLYGVFGLHIIGFLDIPNYSSGYLQLPFVRFISAVIVANTITAGIYFLLYETGVITLTQLLS